MQAARISSKFDTPGLVARSKRTSDSESVTARLNFFMIAAGSSMRYTIPESDEADFDILAVGSWRSVTLAPALGVTAFGSTKVWPKRWLKRSAMSRVISMCCR